MKDIILLLFLAVASYAQNQCYFGPGQKNRAFPDLVPCFDSGQSSCCLLGSVCLSGNACWDPNTGNTYQYGCTDSSYDDPSCPSKCNFNTTFSNWVALEYCGSFAPDTWACHAPESCGKYCPSSVPWDQKLEVLTANACSDMKSDARVALYAPSTIQAILSLPTSVGGSTGYFPPGSTTVVVGYTPISVKPVTTYAKTVPTTPVLIAPEAGSESFVSTAADISGTAVTDASTSASSSGVPTSIPSPISTPSSGLSTGSKAGIGVGVAGGVCLLAALGIAFLNFQRRRRARLAQQASGPQYPQYPPNPQHQSYQGAPYYSPQEKANWPGNYVPPNGQMPTTYGDAQYKAQAPVELASEHRVHELGSEPAPGNTPAPPYADPKDAQHSNSPS